MVIGCVIDQTLFQHLKAPIIGVPVVEVGLGRLHVGEGVADVVEGVGGADPVQANVEEQG